MPEPTPSSHLVDSARAAALHRLFPLDAARHPVLHRLVQLAAIGLRTPVAQVNFISGDRQVSAISVGPGEWERARDVPLQYSYCKHVVRSSEPLLVADARVDPLVRDNPSTTESGVVAYAAVPLKVAGDLVLGALCVVDFIPREWSTQDLQMMKALGDLIIAELERGAHTEAESRHLSAVLESAHDAVVGTDLHGIIRSWNSGAERMFGFAAHEAIGCSAALLSPSTSDHELQSIADRIRRGEAVPRFDTERVRKDGSRISVSVVVTPVIDLAGRVLGATAVLRDISSRVKATSALAESEERFRQLAETVEAVFWLRDVQSGRLLYVSPAYERIWGRSREQLRENPRAWADAVHPDDRERVLAEIDAARASEYSAEYRIIGPEGEERWVCDRGFPVRNADGNVVRMAGVIEDVTESKVLQSSLYWSEARFRALIEHSNEIISVFAEDGSIRYESPAITRILGYSAEELQGQSMFDFVHPDDLPTVRTAFARILEDDGALGVELRFRHKDGSYRAFSSTGVNLLEHPAVQGIVANSRDITELRASEERLRLAQRMEAVGRLAGGIAHDFNNVLTVIKGSASLALVGLAEDSQVRADVEQITDAADRGANLTRQLLAFSRQQVLKPRVLDLNELIAGMEQMLTRSLQGNIELVTELAPDLGRIEADPGQLEQILMNLAVNARDAMPDGGRLTVETRNVELGGDYAARFGYKVRSGGYVMLAVTDTGMGIRKEAQDRVFEPFFTTKDRDKGTGLGLSTVYGIVKQSGGYIWLYSEEGQGTTFKIYLPRVNAAVAPQAPTGAPEGDRHATILLVEDEAIVRSIARRMLQRMKYNVIEAADGDAAIRASREHEGAIDLLLTDLVMPGISGRELAQTLRTERPSLRVLFTSGFADESLLRDALRDGFGFLQKPYESAQLREMVGHLLQERIGLEEV